MNVLSRITVLVLVLCTGGLIQAQSLAFRADQLTTDPASGSTTCVQVGIYATMSGFGSDQEWQQLTLNLDYADPDGLLAGPPVVDLAVNDPGDPNDDSVAITNPGTPLPDSSCTADRIVNVATLGGAAASYFPVAQGGFITENVNSVTQHITLSHLDTGNIFTMRDGQEHLVAIVEFPLAATGSVGQIELSFTSGAGQNFVNRAARELLDSDGNNTDGIINVFAPIDCSGATVADDLGSASGSNIQINYLDPQVGGNGGEITFTMPHAGQDPDQINISGSDGLNITVPATAGSTTVSLNTGADGSPSANMPSVTYTITYQVEFPVASGTYVSGSACTVTVNWAPATCNITVDPEAPSVGGNADFDVTVTNVMWNGSNFAAIFRPDASMVNLTAPSSTAGTELTFDNAISIVGLTADDFGTYSVNTNHPGFGSRGDSDCSVELFLACPENTTNCAAIPGDLSIGGSVTIPLSGTNVVDWDITYNGTTTNIPGDSTEFQLDNLNGDVTEVVITANGNGPGGPCDDSITCNLDFAAPTCDSATQDPAGQVDVNTVVTLSLQTTGAVNAAIDGVDMTAAAGTPGVDETITWTATHTAVADTQITATVTNPNGETTSAGCSWTIEINCLPPDGLDVPPVGMTGISFYGSAGCTYTLYEEFPNGTVNTYDWNLPDAPARGAGGGLVFYQDNTVVVQPDTLYSLALVGVPPGPGVLTVPTLGEWAMGCFVVLLLGAALTINRRRFS